MLLGSTSKFGMSFINYGANDSKALDPVYCFTHHARRLWTASEIK